MPYLIYPTEKDACDRADEEGKELGFHYWIEDNQEGTRWLTYPSETIDHMWALDVTDYTLDEVEKATTVDTYLPVEQSDET
jgi:hypothetical protein